MKGSPLINIPSITFAFPRRGPRLSAGNALGYLPIDQAQSDPKLRVLLVID